MCPVGRLSGFGTRAAYGSATSSFPDDPTASSLCALSLGNRKRPLLDAVTLYASSKHCQDNREFLKIFWKQLGLGLSPSLVRARPGFRTWPASTQSPRLADEDADACLGHEAPRRAAFAPAGGLGAAQPPSAPRARAAGEP